jgi:hypothetical protein
VPFTLRNLKEDLEDVGSNFDGAPDLEFRMATKALELEQSGLSYQNVPPTNRSVADVASALPQFAHGDSEPKGRRSSSSSSKAVRGNPGRSRCYSGSVSPEPPNSSGKSLSLGRPSFMGSTVDS